AVRNTEVGSYLRTLFGEKVRYSDDSARNALLLSGNGDDIQAAIEAIQVLDQPLFKGRNSIRITPTIWSAEELTKRLTEILLNEGYSVGTTGQSGSAQFPITLLPVAGINSVIVLAQSQEVINHIVEWAKVLDKPAEKSVGRNFFSYQVRNTDASRLADTVQKLLSSTPVRTNAANTTTTGAAGTALSQTANSVGVDKPTNTILFRASGEEYPDIIRLLSDLDRTARQVLIEVTIAEVKLAESMITGVDWIFTKLNSSGTNVTAVGGNTGGTILGNALSAVQGLVVSQLDGSRNPRAVLQAEASDGRVTFLSNPKTLARNGETASIQVGDSIPILTQQQTNSATGGTGIISTVQYAETGTIMKIKPVIHSSDQVDLDITLESSQPGEVGKSGPQSPPISKRTLDTKLTLKHGSTYILGGLISNRKEIIGAGVPFLKDIPVLGRVFKKDSETFNRTELIIMITPYIISDDGEARAVTDAVRKQLGGWAQEIKPGPGTNAEPTTTTK
ncbi:MAG: secretin N-terminal domain-containing protein, partial [Pseudomonadota bacterium]